MHLHSIHHVPYEGLGAIDAWARERGFTHSATWQHLGDELPSLEAIDLLVVMGGPMAVYEEEQLPWLTLEKALIRSALERDLPVLGVCLGAQLLAEALGARVAPHHCREIGWGLVRRQPPAMELPWMRGLPDPLDVLHWHGDRFEIPPRAHHLWSSDRCDNQGFALKTALGLQFHLELLPDDVRALLQAGGGELPPAESLLGDPERFTRAHQHLCQLLDAWWESLVP